MRSKQIRSSPLPEEPLGTYEPLLPTVVVASYKGGVWKTSVAVAVAERLAWAGLAVLLLTCDTQEDARARLGVGPSEPMAARRAYGTEGSITAVGIRGAKAVDLLYRIGPQGFGLSASFDIVVVDTPPEEHGVRLPGVMLFAMMDGMDAARNLITALRRTPANTEITLVHAGWTDPEEWADNVGIIEEALGRTLYYIGQPLPRHPRIAEAHNEGRSVWTLPRRGDVRLFLSNINTLAECAWERFLPGRHMPAVPPATASGPYVPGWDD